MINRISKFNQVKSGGNIYNKNPKLISDKQVERKPEGEKVVVENVTNQSTSEFSSSFENYEENTEEKGNTVDDACEHFAKFENFCKWQSMM